MSDFLANLAARALSIEKTIQPRMPGRFEPQDSPLKSEADDGKPAADSRCEESREELETSPHGASREALPAETSGKNANADSTAASTGRAASRRDAIQKSDFAIPDSSIPEFSSPWSPGSKLTSVSRPESIEPRHASEPGPAAVMRMTGRSDRREEGGSTFTNAPQPLRPAHEHGGREERTQEPSSTGEERVESSDQRELAPRNTLPIPHESHARVAASLAMRNPVFKSAAAPAVQVTIGRVEIRAVPPRETAPARRRPQRREAISLEEYLRSRTGERSGR